MTFGRLWRMTEFDERDAALLAALQEDARRSNRELARLIGVSPSTCLERVRALRARGVIRGFHAELDLESIGRPIQALVAVGLRPNNRAACRRFFEFCDGLDGVISSFLVSGEHDVLVHVAAMGPSELLERILEPISSVEGVVDVRTSLIFEHRRRHAVRPAQLVSRPGSSAGSGSR